MEFERLEIPEIVLCKPQVHGDSRGYFIETFREDLLENFLGYKINFCQDNESKSNFGVLRGLHFQLPPFAQTKLVRVIKGSVLDIAVDIRRNSPTFGKYVSQELNDENKFQLLIPRGFAHGFLVLSNETIFAYKVDNYYSKECDRGIAYDDPKIGIKWKIESKNLLLSDKDTKQPLLREAKELFEYMENYYV